MKIYDEKTEKRIYEFCDLINGIETGYLSTEEVNNIIICYKLDIIFYDLKNIEYIEIN